MEGPRANARGPSAIQRLARFLAVFFATVLRLARVLAAFLAARLRLAFLAGIGLSGV